MLVKRWRRFLLVSQDCSALQIQFHAVKLKHRCFHSWSSPWQAAGQHYRRALLHRTLAAFQQAVIDTNNLLVPHWEYWQHGVVLLRAWQCWMTVTLRRKFLQVTLSLENHVLITCCMPVSESESRQSGSVALPFLTLTQVPKLRCPAITLCVALTRREQDTAG